MTNILWEPDPTVAEASQMAHFRNRINQRFQLNIASYSELYSWSVEQISEFWKSVWDFSGILHSEPPTQIVDQVDKMPGARWFSGARLNFAENLLRFRDNHTAILFQGEGQTLRSLTYHELYDQVSRVQQALIQCGVRKGDRVAGFLPNLPETVIAMLAATSLGAVWSSSSPDFGINGVLDRFTQIDPKVLFAADGYFYNGKTFDTREKLQSISSALPSVEQVVLIPYANLEVKPDSRTKSWDEFLKPFESREMTFIPYPFDHPLYIMYSSGTTGLPKSIVHGAGGTLLQHMKELRLHTDLTRDDVIFYYTTCGWMMWNWLVSSLAVGATIVLYDGSPFYPDPSGLWTLADELGITVFGTSAKYIAACESHDVRPVKTHRLNSLRTILSTGSPLMEENFDYVYQQVKADLQLASISGGTDIISCFALGSPLLPVRRGELQCRGLGMKVEAFDENGRSVLGKKGELVCTRAFPSMPVYFWNDPDGEKYARAYFRTCPGVWRHGDYIEINAHGGVKIFGRSDATLNPGGVRIGTAEIYRVLERIPAVSDSLVVGQNWEEDERVILFIKLKAPARFTDSLQQEIRALIRTECSPRHVPAKILPVPDIPYTINGKKVEIAVKKIIHGQEVRNRDALANPDALDFYRNRPELQS
ncbi:MAG: acetoacetate--CoA ligase [Fidelibacterota bacterium]